MDLNWKIDSLLLSYNFAKEVQNIMQFKVVKLYSICEQMCTVAEECVSCHSCYSGQSCDSPMMSTLFLSLIS